MLAIAVILIALIARAEATPADDVALAKHYADILTGVDQDVADAALDDDDDDDADIDDAADEQLEDAPLPRRDLDESRLVAPPTTHTAPVEPSTDDTLADLVDAADPTMHTATEDALDDLVDNTDPPATAPDESGTDDAPDDTLDDLVDDDSPALGELTGLDLATLHLDPAELAVESAAFQTAGGAELFDLWERHQRPSRFGRLAVDVSWRSYSSDPRIAPHYHSDELWLIATWRR